VSDLLIFDATALHHFGRAGRLETLREVTEGFVRHVAQAVIDEIAEATERHAELAALPAVSWLTSVPCDSLDELKAFLRYAEALGSGERDVGEAITLAWAEVHSAIAIVDERAGRSRGNARGVQLHGSLWLILRAYSAGRLLQSEAQDLVDQLAAVDMRLPCDGAGLFAWARANGIKLTPGTQ
jgi:predicted nucleic acid-binding protein